MVEAPLPNPAWARVLHEITSATPPNVDTVRRNKLAAISHYTGNSVILHATACTVPSKVLAPQLTMLDYSDVKSFETVTELLPPGPLDVILHSPGGLAEAVESIVRVLRPKFNPVRFVVPSLAKSAGTMLSMSSNEILLHPNGELGPTDPQMIVGNTVASADAILAQFEQARDELLGNPDRGITGDHQRIIVWGPILGSMGPALLVQCQNAKELARGVVTNLLNEYMFAGDPTGTAKAQGIATALNDHSRWLSHGRRIGLDDLQRLGVNARSLAEDAQLLSLVDEAWAATDLTLSNSRAFRLTENHLGHTVVKQVTEAPGIAIQLAPQEQPQTPTQPPDNPNR